RRVLFRSILLSLNSLRRHRVLSDGIQISLVYLFANGFNKLPVAIKIDLINRADALDLFHHQLIIRDYQLASRRVVGFITFLFLSVLRSGQHNASLTLKVTYGQGKFRRVSEMIENINVDASG